MNNTSIGSDQTVRPCRVLLTTFGTLGDLHPYIAVGHALQQQGHHATIATSEFYRGRVESTGLSFAPLRPNLAYFMHDQEALRKAVHPRTGANYLLRQMMLPHLDAMYEDLLPLAREADVLVNHVLSFATPVVADVLEKPWVSVALQPMSVVSEFEQPAVAAAPFLEHLRWMGPILWRTGLRFGKIVMRQIAKPINDLRKRVGVPETDCPVFDSFQSPHAAQAWFSNSIATRRPDWPANLQVTGFPFYDESEQPLAPELERFMNSGPPPVVFTLGSAAVLDAGTFYSESLKAAQQIGCRAVLLIGSDERNQPRQPLPPNIITAAYAPYAQLFPRASLVVHQGGIGTTAYALRSGAPMIFVPYSHDQPDNARRVVNIGAGRVIARKRYDAASASRMITEVMNGASYRAAARKAASLIATEGGASTAARLIAQLA